MIGFLKIKLFFGWIELHVLNVEQLTAISIITRGFLELIPNNDATVQKPWYDT